MPLSDREVRHAEPRARPYYLIDGDGLYLKIAPTGTKTWFLRSQGTGGGWLSLGRYPAMGLAKARQEAKARREGGMQVRTVAEAYAAYEPTLQQSYRRPHLVVDRFTNDVIPRLGTRRVDLVTRADIQAVLQAIVDRGSPVQANRTLPDLKHFFAFCLERGWTVTDPTVGITRKSVGGRERPRDRVLSREEVGELIWKLYRAGWSTATRLAVGILLATGQRSSEVLGLDRKEVRGGLWIIPAARTKTGVAHQVSLSPQSRALLRRAFHHLGRQPFRTLRPTTLSRAFSRMGLDRPYTPHDLRRTMATHLAELGVPPHVVEKMLNHRMRGVMAVYNRAEYLPERRAAWRAWGLWLATIRRQMRRSRAAPAAGG